MIERWGRARVGRGLTVLTYQALHKKPVANSQVGRGNGVPREAVVLVAQSIT